MAMGLAQTGRRWQDGAMTRLIPIACLTLLSALPLRAEEAVAPVPVPEAEAEAVEPETPAAPDPLWLPTRTEGDVRLTGALAEEIAASAVPRLAGYAMVCLLPARDAFLPIRAQPGEGGAELAEAPLFAALGLTGQLSSDHAWVEVDLVWLTHDTDGNRLPVDSAIPLRGWVPAAALCRFAD